MYSESISETNDGMQVQTIVLFNMAMENPEKISLQFEPYARFYRSNKVIFFTMMPYAYYFTANSPFIVQSNRIKMAIPCDENHQSRF